MDAVLEQVNSQERKAKPQLTKLQIAYKIYHFVAKIFLYSILVILVLVAIAFILYFVDMQINAKKGVNKQPLFGAYIIISPSMVPTINVYDAIVIKRAEPDELEVGDIITFLSSDPRYSGLTITHRIVGVEKSKTGDLYFRTKGDNNNTEDSSLVKGEDVYGKVMLRIPKIGYIQSVLTSAVGWVILIVIPCLGVVIYDIIKVFKSIGKGKSKKENEKLKENDDSEYIETVDAKPVERAEPSNTIIDSSVATISLDNNTITEVDSNNTSLNEEEVLSNDDSIGSDDDIEIL